jgi:hypothetical protein
MPEKNSRGWEGGLAPAEFECHSASGGKPTFLTMRLQSRIFAFVI